MNRTGNCYLKRLALVFVCALSVRIAVVAIHCSSDAIEQHDAHSELVWVARNLVAGRGFSSPFGPGDSPTAWFSPALPILWSFVMRAVGEGDTFLAIILYLNALGSALSVVVYALILKGLVAPGKLRPRAFMMATGVLCLWPPALMLTTYTWYYCWQELGIALLFLALQRWHVSEFNLRASLCVGCCAALAAYINPSILIVLIAAIAYQFCRSERRRRVLASAILIISVLGILILPWTLRNYRALHKLVPMRSNFSVEFQQGNNPEGSIRQHLGSLHPALSPGERAKYDALGEGPYTTQAMDQTLAYIKENARLTVGRSISRAYVFWCSDITDHWPWVPRDKWWTQGIAVKGWWISKIALHTAPWILALITLSLGYWKSLRTTWLLSLHTIFFPLPYYITHCSPEYAYPVQPFLMIFFFAALCQRSRSCRRNSDADSTKGPNNG